MEYRVHAFVIAGDRADALKVQHWGLPGFDHEESSGLLATLGQLKKKGADVFQSFGHLPEFLHHHEQNGGTNHKRDTRIPSIYAQQSSTASKHKKKAKAGEAEMNEMMKMLNGGGGGGGGSSSSSSSGGGGGDFGDNDLVAEELGMSPSRAQQIAPPKIEGMGNFLSNDKSVSKKGLKKRKSMFSSKRRHSFRFKSDEEDLEYEKHLEKLRLEQETEVQKAAEEAGKVEESLKIKRLKANKSRLMSKLRKHAVQVGEQKSDEKQILASGGDPRQARVLKRRRQDIMGNALSESTWERLGADVSTLDAGHQVELSHVIIETVKHLDHKMHHHIIACGPLAALWSFILPLRSKHVQVVQPIVILSRILPTEEEWARYSRFPDIYLVRGSPLNISDLHAAGTNSASRAVLFADEGMSRSAMGGDDISGGTGGGANVSENANKFGRQMRDSSTILAYRALKVVNPRINVTVELISSENLRLLDESEMGSGTSMRSHGGNALTNDSSNEDLNHTDSMLGNMAEVFGINASDNSVTESWLSPSFASGHAFLSTVTDTIFAQSFYNRHLIAIIQELVIGTPDILAETWNKVLGSEIGMMHDSHLYLIVIPKDYHNRSYSFVLYSLLQKGVLAMGLRRGVTKPDNKTHHMGMGESNTQPYVYTNPSPSTIVRHEDLLYVLCHGAPHDLGLDIALFDYEIKQNKKDIAKGVIEKLKGLGIGKAAGSKNSSTAKMDRRRRGSMMSHMHAVVGDNIKETKENDSVGVPESMITGKKHIRRFTVTKTDLVHTSPMVKLAKQV